jgi:hypothetical protein
MARSLFLLLFGLAVMGFSQVAFADTYQLTFTGAGAPEATDFSYSLSTGFTSDIVVVWNGVTFDFTPSSLNSWVGAAGSCSNVPPGMSEFDVLTGAGCSMTTPATWAAETINLGTNGFNVFDLGDLGLDISGASTGASFLSQGGKLAVANLSGVATPEPGAISMLLSGLSGLALLVTLQDRCRLR